MMLKLSHLRINNKIGISFKMVHLVKFINYLIFNINLRNYYCLFFFSVVHYLTYQKNTYSAYQMFYCSYIYLHSSYFFACILCFSFLYLSHLLCSFLIFQFFTICRLMYSFSAGFCVFCSFLQVFFCFDIRILLVSANFHMLIKHLCFHVAFRFKVFLVNFLFI